MGVVCFCVFVSSETPTSVFCVCFFGSNETSAVGVEAVIYPQEELTRHPHRPHRPPPPVVQNPDRLCVGVGRLSVDTVCPIVMQSVLEVNNTLCCSLSRASESMCVCMYVV